MARKVSYNITRFDGGMSDDIRVNDLSKCARVQHFDIYCDPHKLVPMPGYVADQDTVAGGADDLQNYNIKAFHYDSDATLMAVGTKSNGTGTKLFEKASPTTASWTATTNGEGTDTLADGTFLVRPNSSSAELWFVTEDAGTTYLSKNNGTTTTDKAGTLSTSSSDTEKIAYKNLNLNSSYDVYLNKVNGKNIASLATDTYTASAKTTLAFLNDINAGGDFIGAFGNSLYPWRSQLLLWDASSALIDQRVDFGNGYAAKIGYPGGTWIGVVNEGLWDTANAAFPEQVNGEYTAAIKAATGSEATTIYRIMGKSSTNANMRPLNDAEWRDAILFYVKTPLDATPTTYNESIWAVGRCKPDSPLAVSQLLDVSGLGSIEGYYQFGTHMFFAHGGDGSVSRLDNLLSGTYDVECVYESLMFGSDSPYLKEFKGITVQTEDLPSGASVEVKYRFDEDDSWTSLGTSSTTGDEQHNFTRASGVPIGKFQEIQFRVDINGKAAVKGIHITLVETDDLPYNH